MKKRTLVPMIMAVIIVAWGASATASVEDQLSKLKRSFMNRYQQLLKLKGEGKIGETWDGWIEAVRPEYMREAAVRTVVDGENRDRGELYRLMAAQQNVTTAVVAQRNAARLAEKALPGHYFKGKDGVWRRVSEKK